MAKAFRDEAHRIYLLRHGQTEWNKFFRYQGVSDVPLSEEGEAQARALAARLSRVEPAAVYTSPLVRARRTAEITAEGRAGFPAIESRPELIEMSFGVWEGRSIDEVREAWPELYARWSAEPFCEMPEGSESPDSVFARCEAMASLLRERAEHGTVSFVYAHGALIRVLIAALIGTRDIKPFWRMRLDNCSITTVDLWGGRAMIAALNDTHHLRLSPEEAAALTFGR